MFYAAVWGIIAGIIVAELTGEALVVQSFFLPVSIVIIVLCLRHASPLALIVAFLAAFMLGNLRTAPYFQSQELITPYFGTKTTIAGKISEDPDTSKNPTAIRLSDLQLLPTDRDPVPLQGVLYATVSDKYQLARSDLITIEGKLQAGFGTFIGKMSRPEILQLERPSPGDIFGRLKTWFSELVRQFVPSPEVDLGLGYLMGMKSGLSTEFSDMLRAVGMTHVVVASGAHLAILTSAARKLFGKISKFTGLLFSLLMITFFVLIVGFTPSMTRAALVSALSLLTGYVGRKFTPLRLISFVAMLTLLIEPTNFLDLGWQLSFASFFGILIVSPRLTATFYGGKRPPWLASMLLTSFSTSLLCAPILLYNFGSISFLSFVANLIILPTLPYAMLGLLLTGVSSFLPFLPAFLGHLTTWLLDLHIWLVEFLSDKTAFIVELPPNNPCFYLLYLPVLFFLAYPALRKLYRRLRPRPVHPAAILSENSS